MTCRSRDAAKLFFGKILVVGSDMRQDERMRKTVWHPEAAAEYMCDTMLERKAPRERCAAEIGSVKQLSPDAEIIRGPGKFAERFHEHARTFDRSEADHGANGR